MTKNHRLIFTTVLLTISITCKAQFYPDLMGRVNKENISADVEGSPYLIKDWADGSVTIEKGVYKSLKLKYNINNDEVVFLGKDNAVMNVVDPVKKFSIGDRNFVAGFPAVSQLTKTAFYEVLSDGKATLLKHYTALIQETRSYGSAAVNRQYAQSESYFVFINGKMIVAKPDRKAILEILADKATELDTYAKANKLNFKKDADLGKLVDYYNSLVK